jgi:hypothetical protein
MSDQASGTWLVWDPRLPIERVRECGFADLVSASSAEQAVERWASEHDARAQLISSGHPMVVCVQRVAVQPGASWRNGYQPEGPIEKLKACGEYVSRFWAERVD